MRAGGAQGRGMQMRLDEVKCGQSVRISAVEDAAVRLKLMRLGIAEGTLAVCAQKVFGTVIVACGGQQIAVGRSVARRVRVTVG